MHHCLSDHTTGKSNAANSVRLRRLDSVRLHRVALLVAVLALAVCQPQLGVDLLHALLVRRSHTHTAEDDIHLLQGQLLGLGDEEEDEQRAQQGEQAEEDEGAVFQPRDHVRRHLPDDKVVHPVGTGAQRDAVRPGRQRPHLGHQDPCAGPPRPAEVAGEQPHHDDGRPAGRVVRRPLVLVLGEDDGDDDVAGAHGHGARDEHGLAADLVDPEDHGDGGDQHD